MDATQSYPFPEMSFAWRQAVRRGAPLAIVVLLHVALLYALTSGLLHNSKPLMPHEVLVHFITAETIAPPAPPTPKPVPQVKPKTLPAVSKPVRKPVPRPIAPAVNITPSEQAITLPTAPEQTAPAQPFVAAEPQAAASAAPAAAPAAPAAPKTISSGVEYLSPPRPEYPILSRRRGEEGKVVLRALINPKGRPDQVEIQTSSGSVRLDEAARQAVQRAVFKPHMEDGKAVAVYAIVPIKFQLDR